MTMLSHFAASGGAIPVYIEDVFSTWLYTGNGSTQTITNGIDLAGKGGMTWIKTRSVVESHVVVDTARGAANALRPNSTAASINDASRVSAFTASGFTVGNNGETNDTGVTYASWTFREQPKFFDVVTYTGDGSSSGKVINHNLGSIPGAVIIKRTDSTSDWWAQVRRSDGQYAYGLRLNSTAAQQGLYTPTSGQLSSTQFSNFIADDPLATNTNGATYVAYLFAHDAGGFGLTGTDNVISCGSFSQPDGNNVTVNLGYEPQLVMFKRTDATGNWVIADNMRGMAVSDAATGSGNPVTALRPNSSAAEEVGYGYISPTATGFIANIANPASFIYIAIRRGPMRTPTTGTSVFNLANKPGSTFNVGFPTDLGFWKWASGTQSFYWKDRLRGGDPSLTSANTNAESFPGTTFFDGQNSMSGTFIDSIYYMGYYLRRAPGFMDVCCYTGTGSARTVAHNLTVVPELMIVKSRSAAGYWPVYSAAIGNDYILSLDTTGAKDGPGAPQWNGTTPTASVFSLGASIGANASGVTFVAYLFASCPGVQSIQSYVGDGATGRTINCGFTGGARFVCIKATSTTGSWWTFDSARGIVTNNDPALQLNSTAAEVTSADAIDTAASGFIVNQEATCSLNASGVSYLVWAIA